MKPFALGCRSMPDGIMVTLVFLIVALLMILTAHYLVPDVGYLREAVRGAGLVLLLLSPVILVGTWLRTRSHPNDLGHD